MNILYIEKISIGSFGSLSEKVYELNGGINIIYGENESGKSTLAAFVKFIFYGMSGKTPDQSMTEKSRYTSWESGISSGSIVLNDKGKRYRIERTLLPAAKASGKESVKITDADTNTELFRGRCPGEVFFGVSEDVFAQTAFSAQGSGNLVDSAGMNNAINNILFSADESISVKTALKKLDDARVFLLHKNKKGGRIFTLEGEIGELENKIRDSVLVNSALAEKNESLNKYTAELDECNNQLKFYSDVIERIKAENILEKLDALDNAERKREALAEKHNALTEKYMHNGFLPDEKYSSLLKSSESEVLLAENNLKNAVKRRDDIPVAKPGDEYERIHKAALELGGREAVVKKLFSFSSKISAYKRALVIFSVLAGIFAVTGITLLAVSAAGLIRNVALPVFASFALAAMMMLCSAFSLRKYSDFGKRLEKLLSDINSEEIIPAVRKLEASEAAFEKYEKQKNILSELDSDIAACSGALADAVGRAAQLLSRWGIACPRENSHLIRAILSKSASSCDSAISDIRLCERELNSATSAYDAMLVSCAGYEREKCIETVKRTEYTKDCSEDRAEAERRLAFHTNRKRAMEEKIQSLKIDAAALGSKAQDTHAMSETLSDLIALKNELTEKHNACYLAREVLIRASESLREKIAPALTRDASEMMRSATDGKLSGIYVDSSLEMTFQNTDSSPTRELGFMSEGTKALSYVALRLALIKLLFRKENTPCVIFDESFVHLDDSRLKNVLTLLSNYSNVGAKDETIAQVIILTCSDREINALDKTSCINKINL